MRELKFRAWDDVNKRFPFVGFGILGETTVFDLCAQYQLEHALTLHIDQATGLKDKNGVEIFEGDVVTGGGIVIWNAGAAEFIVNFPGIEAQGMEEIDEWAEVIGNIHQNKELLKSDK